MSRAVWGRGSTPSACQAHSCTAAQDSQSSGTAFNCGCRQAGRRANIRGPSCHWQHSQSRQPATRPARTPLAPCPNAENCQEVWKVIVYILQAYRLRQPTSCCLAVLLAHVRLSKVGLLHTCGEGYLHRAANRAGAGNGCGPLLQ